MVEAFESPAITISSASPGPLGGYRGLTALRQKLEPGLGATVMPAMAAVVAAYEGEADGNLVDDRIRAMLDKAVGQLIAAAAR